MHAGPLRALSVAGCHHVGGAGLQELCRVCARTLLHLDASRTCIKVLPSVVGKVWPPPLLICFTPSTQVRAARGPCSRAQLQWRVLDARGAAPVSCRLFKQLSRQLSRHFRMCRRACCRP